MQVKEYQFTQDWFHWSPKVWEQLVPLLSGEAGKRTFIEIGSFEGRSTVWIAENMMQNGDWIICIDTWEGGEEHSAEDMAAVEARFDHNTQLFGIKHNYERVINKNKGKSTHYLAYELHDQKTQADFIYIDGSHTAPDVLTDACMAWPLLKQGGIMVFDDYLWGTPRDILHRPKIAIDAFVNIFAEEVDIIHSGYQFIVKKK
jgi:predicted O-methyltransferase YrrM